MLSKRTDGMGDHRAEAEFHAEAANRLLADCKNGAANYGPYAPSAVTAATAAQAHALMAQWHDARAREGVEA